MSYILFLMTFGVLGVVTGFGETSWCDFWWWSLRFMLLSNVYCFSRVNFRGREPVVYATLLSS